MGIKIGDYTFEGPYASTNSIEDRSGVYAILCNSGNKNTVVDIGESATVKSRVATHDRRSCWSRNCTGNLRVAVLYTPNKQQSGRMEIEQELRDQFDPPCGKR